MRICLKTLSLNVCASLTPNMLTPSDNFSRCPVYLIGFIVLTAAARPRQRRLKKRRRKKPQSEEETCSELETVVAVVIVSLTGAASAFLFSVLLLDHTNIHCFSCLAVFRLNTQLIIYL